MNVHQVWVSIFCQIFFSEEKQTRMRMELLKFNVCFHILYNTDVIINIVNVRCF